MNYRSFLFILLLLNAGISARGQSKQIKTIVKELQADSIQSDSDFLKSEYFAEFRSVNSDSVFLFYDKAEEVKDVSRLLLGKVPHANVVRTIGVMAYTKNLMEYALKYFEEALVLFQTENQEMEVARTSSNMAVINEVIGNYAKALDLHYKALEVMKKLNDKQGMSFVYNNIAVAYVEMNDYDKSLSLYRKALALKTELNDSSGIASTCNNIGVLFSERFEDVDSMSYYLRQAIEMYILLGDSVNYATSLNNLSEQFILSGQLHEAKENSEKALEIFERKNDRRRIGYSLRNLAQIELGLDNLQACETYLDRSFRILEEQKDLPKLLELYQVKQELLIKQGKEEEAVANFKNFVSLKDSLENESLNRSIANAETNYKVFEKESRIADLEKQNRIKRQRVVVFIALSGVLILIILLLILLYAQRKKQTEFRYEELKQQLLRSQMNPHFLFNALASIQSFMYKNEAKKAARYLGNFASLTRSILENSTAEEITLDEDISTLKNYIELEKMRLREQFSYKIFIGEDLDTEDIKIPPMLIQPFVENAIKHGLKNLDYEGELLLSFNQIENVLAISVKDNGHGIHHNEEKDEEKTHRSMSMSIFKDRARILSKKYQRNIEFKTIDLSEINPEQRGTEVKIHIPI
ncbi:tetratricopeptide repeat-containing sensor histidine kinase [Maribellus maritimus]|uniref:tetratricopeptide repeat-containing sensor histidine kinase n=1 Tax=Maribellus maritimus TaxID=2870838 RepID=UPI001EEC12B1|nr:tetratricopeptide repeat protein [Maribellus maritimus]MCG6188679.1 tetratricopeptide repeat protein [Maribellus maritimus]